MLYRSWCSFMLHLRGKKKKWGEYKIWSLSFTKLHPSWRAIVLHAFMNTDGSHFSTGSECPHFPIPGRISLIISYLSESRRSVLLFTTTEKLTHGPPSFLFFCLFKFWVLLFSQLISPQRAFLGRACAFTFPYCHHLNSLQLCSTSHFPHSFKHPRGLPWRRGG